MLNEAAYLENTASQTLGATVDGAKPRAVPGGPTKALKAPAKVGVGGKAQRAKSVKTGKAAKSSKAREAHEASDVGEIGDGGAVDIAARQVRAPMRADAQTGVLPLDMLCRAEDNVRTRGTDEADGIPALAELIFSFGLINPLSVVDADARSGEDHRYPVAAGDRRLRALQLLAAQGRIRPDEPIDVRRFASQDALALSLAENTARLDMHPVDQFEAFRKLVEVEGKTVEAVADAYGISALTVRRRLALSKIAPELLDLFRTGSIAQDQLQVLALVSDPATQVHIWHSAPSWSRSSYHLRTLVLAAEVSGRDHRAVFVGLDAYTAAGGTLRRDLFSDEDGTYLEDVGLLDRLYGEKLEAEAERLRGEGWAWVEVVDNLHGLYHFHRTAPTLRAPTEDEAAQMTELELRLDSLDERLEKIGVLIDESEDDSGQDDRLYDEQEAFEEERGAVELQCEALRDRRKEFSAQARAISGVRITAASGTLAMAAGLIRHADFVQQSVTEVARDDGRDEDAGDGSDCLGVPDDDRAESAVSIQGVSIEVSRYAGSGPAGSSTEGGGSGKSKTKAEYGEKVIADLSAHRTAALQAALLDHPRAALATLALALLSNDERGDYRTSVPAKVQATTCGHSLRQKASGYDASRAGLAMGNAEARMYLMLGLNEEGRRSDRWAGAGDSGAIYARLLALDLESLVGLLTYLSARTVDVIGPRPAKPDSADQLADVLQLDMADYWQAGSDNFFIHVPKAKAVEAVSEAKTAQDAEPLSKMKKAEAATAAETLVAGTHWLPVPLRRMTQTSDAVGGASAASVVPKSTSQTVDRTTDAVATPLGQDGAAGQPSPAHA